MTATTNGHPFRTFFSSLFHAKQVHAESAQQAHNWRRNPAPSTPKQTQPATTPSPANALSKRIKSYPVGTALSIYNQALDQQIRDAIAPKVVQTSHAPHQTPAFQTNQPVTPIIRLVERESAIPPMQTVSDLIRSRYAGEPTWPQSQRPPIQPQSIHTRTGLLGKRVVADPITPIPATNTTDEISVKAISGALTRSELFADVPTIRAIGDAEDDNGDQTAERPAVASEHYVEKPTARIPALQLVEYGALRDYPHHTDEHEPIEDGAWLL